jgi:CheY-like chemotaxis protein
MKMKTGEYVLIVEDEPNAMMLFTVLVTLMGEVAQGVGNGTDALRQIHERPPGLVILDLIVPGAHGFQVLRQLRDDPLTRDIPVVVVTGTNVEKQIVLDQHDNVLDVIRKGDFDYQTIEEIVKRVMMDAGSHRIA